MAIEEKNDNKVCSNSLRSLSGIKENGFVKAENRHI
jgi:folate-dependent tRNA-U54 methylase TrmFO/GidA